MAPRKSARSKAASMLGRIGGKARLRKLSKKKRVKVATDAANARWNRTKRQLKKSA